MQLLELIRKALKPRKQADAGNIDKAALREERLRRALRLKHLIAVEGYADFIALIDDYIEKSLLRKLKTRIDTADGKIIEDLRLLDHEILFCSGSRIYPRNMWQR
jgi:hypothetical protein